MSKIRTFALALLVTVFALFTACDDDEKTEEEPQAGETVECVVTEEEDCMPEAGQEEVVEMDMEVPVEAGEEVMPEEDMMVPDMAGQEEVEMPEAGTQETNEETTEEVVAGEETPTEETQAGESGEPVDPAPQAGEQMPG